MAEFDPDAHLILTGNGEEQRMDRTNSQLFTFIGQNAMYNHVFVVSEEQSEDNAANVTSGTYIFRHSPVFEQLVGYMFENSFPGVVNQLEVPDCDREAFDRSLEIWLGNIDELPEDWTK